METSSFVLFVLIHSGEILFRYYFYQKKNKYTRDFVLFFLYIYPLIFCRIKYFYPFL